MSLPLFPSLFVRAAPELGKVIGDQRIVVPTLASSVYRRDTVPSKARLASRNSITSFEVIAGFWTAAVVEVMDVEPNLLTPFYRYCLRLFAPLEAEAAIGI